MPMIHCWFESSILPFGCFAVKTRSSQCAAKASILSGSVMDS
jgi:hypothetical protein